MKARDAFEKIRRRNKGKLNFRGKMIMLVSLEIVGSVLLALGISEALDFLIPQSIHIPLLIELTVLSLLVGIIVTAFMSKLFFKPIKELRIAIGKVADGDFSITLSTKSTSKEIQEIFMGFNLMTQELKATEVLQTDFVSNVSHEFKTPINAIEGYTTLLQDCENLNASQQEYVEKILFNTKRLSVLVGNILLLSKIENQSIQTGHNKFRLDEQIRKSIVALESEWEKKEIEFDVEMESIEYVGNEGLLHHIWDNLIGNAVKFSPYGGLITIKLKKDVTENGENGKIIFIIEDNGPGLSDEALKHMFDKFYQADSSHKQEGNGLGLTLVKRILVIAGGDIVAENRERGGCRFKIEL